MDSEKLIEQLKYYGTTYAIGDNLGKEIDGSDELMLNAATTLSTLQDENEKLRAELDRLRELVEVDKTLKEFAEDVARQFGYHGTTADGRPAYTCGGLSTLEWAWNILDWPDPKPAPECECQEEGCHEWATGGRPTPDGYKWLCGRHFAAFEAREEAQAALRREQDGNRI